MNNRSEKLTQKLKQKAYIAHTFLSWAIDDGYQYVIEDDKLMKETKKAIEMINDLFDIEGSYGGV